jgi:regulator of RNase E activity RraA
MPILPHSDLLQLKRWNTPTIYNGWEQITKCDSGADAFNIEETRDFMPQMGPMVGYAVTVVIEPSNKAHREANPNAGSEYRRYIASIPGPKIVIVQDLDKPRVIGSFWGEVNSNIHRALGCVGTVRWNCEVEVFGRTIRPGDLIHADKHGFLVIPTEDQSRILEASRFMDSNECETVIPAARNSSGLSTDQLLTNLESSITQFSANVKTKFRREGEW